MSTSISQAVIWTAIQHLRDGNVRRAKALGFTDDELRELRRMSATELDELAHDAHAVCRIALDHTMLLAKIRRITADKNREAQIERALRLDASTEMMTRWFGMSGNDCATRRILLGLVAKQGRRPEPTESEEHDAWQRWQGITPQPDDLERSLADISGMMTLADETGLSLSVLYGLIKRWHQPAAEGARQWAV
ncbi:DUF2857 domain-containing protein [Billgrantia desiderata]|jgi:hypothetical protein|uniref:DUF2857 domain-containing protein n=1 Tax=Billgrantia desiderata TaxID=52021 RepID=UPI00089F1B74|nr:DUF2857 domain-containing protein [Halomonas desiderata]MCE8014096.1 DUF2857 domain-containing protein [Halomonas desiderata]SEG30716.1 Protein of unknown function [Halomonas desiderata]